MTMQTEKRIDWIDYAKAIGIFLVVVGHTYAGNALTNWIYSFHMPLFFFLSGTMLRNRGGYWQYIVKRFKRMLIPYLLYSIIYLVYNFLSVVVLHKDYNLIKNMIGIFLQLRWSEYSLGLWFLPLLFLSEIIVAAVIRLQLSLQFLIIIILTASGFAYAQYVNTPLPWGADAALIVSLFIWLGYISRPLIFNLDVDETHLVLGKVRILCRRMDIYGWIGTVAILVLFLLNIFCNKVNMLLLSDCVDMHALRYGNPLLYILAAFSGIGFTLAACHWLLGNKRLGIMSFIGKNTLHIYCLHQLILAFMKKINESLVIEEYIGIVLTDLLMAMMTLALCCCIIVIVKHWKLKTARD